MVSPPKAVRRDLFVEELDGELIVYDPRLRTAHILNASAAAIFLLCDGSTAVREISDTIAEGYTHSPEDLDLLVSGIIDDFASRDMLERNG